MVTLNIIPAQHCSFLGVFTTFKIIFTCPKAPSHGILNTQVLINVYVCIYVCIHFLNTYLILKRMSWASLVAQWLRIRLPVQGTQVQALVREEPTCHGAAKPVCHY